MPAANALGKFAKGEALSPQEFWENVAIKLEAMKRDGGVSIPEATAFLHREVRAFVESQGTTNTIDKAVANDFNSAVLKAFAPDQKISEGGAFAVNFTGAEDLGTLALMARVIAQQLANNQNTLLIASADRTQRQIFGTELGRQGVSDLHRVEVPNLSRVNASIYLGPAQGKLPVIYDATGRPVGEGMTGIGANHDLKIVTPADLALTQFSRTLLQFAAARYIAFAKPGTSVNALLKAALIKEPGLVSFAKEIQDLPDLFQPDGQNSLAVSENAVFKMLNFVTEMRAKEAVKSAA